MNLQISFYGEGYLNKGKDLYIGSSLHCKKDGVEIWFIF